MTKDQIEEYLYFFWAPLLKENAVAVSDVDAFQRMIILTLSQASAYIEAPNYQPGLTNRNYEIKIVDEITAFAEKIVANIPDGLANDSVWLRITNQRYFFTPVSTDIQLEKQAAFGPYEIEGNQFISFSFYIIPHQIQLQLPQTAEISAIICSKTPFDIPDGNITDVHISDCTLWLSAIQLDANVGNASFYTGLRLKECNISLEIGYTKFGNKIAAGFFDHFAGFVITCTPDDEAQALPTNTVASSNTLTYPNKIVFSFKHRIGLPPPPKISLTHTEPFRATLFGSQIASDIADNSIANWVPDKNLLSFPLTILNDSFSATVNSSPVFDLKGSGKINNVAWYLQPISISHTLALSRLGLAADAGGIGFSCEDRFTLNWSGLENKPLELKDFSLRSSSHAFFFNYTFKASLTAKQKLQLWAAKNGSNSSSQVDITYTEEAKGNFMSFSSGERHAFNAGINLNIDRPLLSNGERVYLKTSGEVILIHNGDRLTVALLGRKIDPASAFNDGFFRQLSSLALSNALILINPVKGFLLAGDLDDKNTVVRGQCIIQFPVQSIEHTLPDPYITSLFNEELVNNANGPSTGTLLSIIDWSDAKDAELAMRLADENGSVFTPESTMTDDQLADVLLGLPLPHPDINAYENLLSAAFASVGFAAPVSSDTIPYAQYKSLYHSKINAAGAFSALHILPGNISLVDVSGRASQMGITFSRRLDNAVNGVQAVFNNTGYTVNQTYRIDNNQLVSSGRFVRAFTLPQVQWEPVYFEEQDDQKITFSNEVPFSTHGVPTRMSSANREDVTLAPIPVTNYIIDSFSDEKNQYAAAAHFALPFGMNAVAFFHPFVKDVELHFLQTPKGNVALIKEPYAYSTLTLNQPGFNFKKQNLSGVLQIKATSEGAPSILRDENRLPDPSFHGSVFQMPRNISDINKQNDPFTYNEDSILGKTVTGQFNLVMHGQYVAKQNPPAINFKKSSTAKVPLRRIDFSGYGSSIFSNWLDKYADAGAVSQVKFNILIGRVAHEVVQIKSVIIPYFVPVVRTIIIERKNHGSIIRTDSGWVATGPGEFHDGYDCHPGVIKGVYNVSSIKDTEISLVQELEDHTLVKMAGVYYDGDIKIENVVSGFKNNGAVAESPDKLVPSKKQFGYIILGNNNGVALDEYYTKKDLQAFMTRPDVGALGGPVDCVVNIAGAGQMMHLTRTDVTATSTTLLVAAARGVLRLPKGGSWSVVKKVTNGPTFPLTNDETVPLIRHGKLIFDNSHNQSFIDFEDSLHVIADPLEVEQYAAGRNVLANTEFALLQSTGTQKLLFPRPSFDSRAVDVDGVIRVKPQILVADSFIADPYGLIKGNAIFPDHADVFTLKSQKTGAVLKSLDIEKEKDGISFPVDIAAEFLNFSPPEAVPVGGKSRKLYLVNEDLFKIYIDYGIGLDGNLAKQVFSAALQANEDKRWSMGNQDVAIVVDLGDFKPLLTVRGNFTASQGAKPEFKDAEIVWGPDERLQTIIQVLSILSMLSSITEGGKDVIKEGFNFAMGNLPESWNYQCTIEEKIPVIRFPNAVQLSQLPGPAPLIVEAGLDLGVFFNLSLSADPENLIKAGAGVTLGFEATIQVLLITIHAVTAYGVGTAKVEIFIALPDANPTFKFTMGFGATVAVQLPVVGYVSLTRVISLGASFDNGAVITVGQMLRGVLTIGGGLASVAVQVEASGTVVDKSVDVQKSQWTAVVRGIFTVDVTVAFVIHQDFSESFEHEIDLPNPF